MTAIEIHRAPLLSAVFEAVAGRVRAAHAERARRLALRSLLDLGPHRLDDLGISVGDIADALARPRAS